MSAAVSGAAQGELDDALADAMRRHQAGDLDSARSLYEAILAAIRRASRCSTSWASSSTSAGRSTRPSP